MLEGVSISSNEDLKNKALMTSLYANLRSIHDIDVQYFTELIALFSEQEKKLEAAKNSGVAFEKGFLEGGLQSLSDQKQKLESLKETESESFLAYRKFFKWVLDHQADISIEGGQVKLKTESLQNEYDEITKSALIAEEAHNRLLQ